VIKIYFEPQVSFGQGKLLAQGTVHSFLSLPLLGIETYGSKIYFYYLFRVNKALNRSSHSYFLVF